MILVTGGAGFIGSHFVTEWLAARDEPVVTLDALTYAGRIDNLADVQGHPRHHFVHGDISDTALVTALLRRQAPRAIVHLAAQTHVDRSIAGPEAFVQTNVVGTQRLVDAVRQWWQTLRDAERGRFRFVYMSTDEVYGSVADGLPALTESAPLRPGNPYAASKAAGEHFVLAAANTWGLPVTIVRAANHYGARQHPEKFMPRSVTHWLAGEPAALYGDGLHQRDWLHVRDGVAALRLLVDQPAGGLWNIASGITRSNRDVLAALGAALDVIHPRATGQWADAVAVAPDRPGHDRRYAIDSAALRAATGWRPQVAFDDGIRETVAAIVARWQAAGCGRAGSVRVDGACA